MHCSHKGQMTYILVRGEGVKVSEEKNLWIVIEWGFCLF